ncbi:hypothetical protein BKA80DRAFT_7421 [Phyllosticta citrichinensis]
MSLRQDVGALYGIPTLLLLIDCFWPRPMMSPMYFAPYGSIRINRVVRSRNSMDMHFSSVRSLRSEDFEDVRDLPRFWRQVAEQAGLVCGKEDLCVSRLRVSLGSCSSSAFRCQPRERTASQGGKMALDLSRWTHGTLVMLSRSIDRSFEALSQALGPERMPQSILTLSCLARSSCLTLSKIVSEDFSQALL